MLVNQNLKTAQSELKKIFKKTTFSFVFVGIFSMFINLLMLVPAIYMLQVYDRVLSSRSMETLTLLTIIVVGMFITIALLEIVRAKLLVRIGNKIDAEVSPILFDVIFYLARLNPSKASSAPIMDLMTMKRFMTGHGVYALFDAPWFPVYLFVLYLFSPWFAGFTIIAAVVIFFMTILNELSTKKRVQEANTSYQQSLGYINNNIANSEIIHAMGMSENIKKRWLHKHYTYLEAQSTSTEAANKWGLSAKSLRQLFQALTYGLGAYLVLNDMISAGMIIAGAVLMGRALQPLDVLTNSWKNYTEAKQAKKRLHTLLNIVPLAPETMKLPKPDGSLQLENIVVVPPNSKKASVKGITMNISAGACLGIIGQSASGKSSLARAILAVWPLQSGTVRLDGADIHQWDPIDLGAHIGYLPQDIELFEGTISENISRFNEVDSEKVVDAAKLAGVHELILALPNGYDTYIGTSGVNLSGGQRQRIGLARAVYNDPALVVLDEPNSNLDEHGERALLQTILQLKERKTTVIIITHRPNILAAVDSLAVLSNGLLIHCGSKTNVLQELQNKNQNQPAVSGKEAKQIGSAQ